MSKPIPNIAQALEEMDAGIFASKVSHVLGEAAQSVIQHGDKGRKAKITITLTLERLGDSSQVECTHALESTQLTRRGKVVTSDKTSTPFYVLGNGHMSVIPVNQADIFTYKTEEKA